MLIEVNKGDVIGRGIKISNEWRYDFKKFLDYVSKLPNYGGKNLSIDRINNEGNYEPGNLKWSTRKEQQNNRRSVYDY